MKKRILLRVVLLAVIMLLAANAALADNTCAHSFVSTVHGGKVCQYCFADKAGVVHNVYWDRYEVTNKGHREVFYCSDCKVEWKTTLVSHVYDPGVHGGRVCTVCYADVSGIFHSLRWERIEYVNAWNHEDVYLCDTCGAEWYRQSYPHSFDESFHSGEVCKECRYDGNGLMHIIPNNTYTYFNENSHILNYHCATCNDSWTISDAHWFGSWHNGEVCVVCFHTPDGHVHKPNESGKCRYCDGYLNVVDGYYYIRDEKTTVTGLVSYNGALFFVENGKLSLSATGLTLIGDTFYFLSHGMVQQHNGFAMYDGEWFYLNGGTLDTTASGVYPYDGELFLIAAGRLVDEHTGFAQVPTGEWYLVAEGRVVSEFTGVTEWLGELFEIRNGQMIQWVGSASGN